MDIQQELRRQLPLVVLNVIILLFFLIHAAGNKKLRIFEVLENHAYDARMLFGVKDDQDPRIVIVDIDEKSLAKEGRWPWGRDRIALLLDKLFDEYEVDLVGFDVVFAERDESSGLTILERLATGELGGIAQYQTELDKLRHKLDYDKLFADSIAGRPVILGYYFQVTDIIKSGALPEPILQAEQFSDYKTRLPHANGYGANLQELQEQAAGGGHFNPEVDNDGVVRRVPMLFEFDGNFYESLSLSMTRYMLEVEQIEPIFADELEWLRIGKHHKIPVDAKAHAMVPYRGKRNSFKYVPAIDVMNGLIEKSILKDTIILVGSSAPALFDIRSTPLEKNYPGVEVHANLIAGILDQRIKEIPAWAKGAEVVNILVVGLIITLLLPLLSALWASLATLILLALTVSLNLFAWQGLNWILPIAPALVMIMLMFLLNMSYGFFIERKRKSEITGIFGQYVPPELVEEMSNDPHSYSLNAEARQMTVLFSDVRNFTTISEGLDPEELSKLMNDFLTPLTHIIHEHRGTIDKYMGDAVMAFWGAPLNDPDHAQHAVEAGLAMVNKMHTLRDEFIQRGWPELRIGIGINTGSMSVGNMGSEFRMAYTILGDAVNLGSRLEGITKQYSVDIIVGETTKEALPNFVFRPLDQVLVKGKTEPIKIYEPLGPDTEVKQRELDELEVYKQALRTYLAQQWEEAERLFQDLRNNFTNRPLYELYLTRLNYFKNVPPGDDWDGVFKFTTK